MYPRLSHLFDSLGTALAFAACPHRSGLQHTDVHTHSADTFMHTRSHACIHHSMLYRQDDLICALIIEGTVHRDVAPGKPNKAKVMPQTTARADLGAHGGTPNCGLLQLLSTDSACSPGIC